MMRRFGGIKSGAMRTAILAGVLVGLVAATGASDASATTFDGRCTFSGKLTLIDRYTLVPRHRDYEGRALGTCVGTLDGTAFSGPTYLYVDGRMNQPMSCFIGVGNGASNTLTFGGSPDDVDATQLDMDFSEIQVGTEGAIKVTGAYNGHAAGRLSFTRYAGQEQLEGCAGDGLTEIGFDADVQTITTLYG